MKNKLIMNEVKECVDIINNGLGKRNLFQALYLLSRYYANNQKLNNFEIYTKLSEFLKKSTQNYSDDKCRQILEYYSTVYKPPLSNIDYISITQPEMNIINKLSNKNLKNIALTLLVISKYNHKMNPNNDYWCNVEITQISRFSKVKEKKEILLKYIHELYKLGLIKFNKKIIKPNIQVLFVLEPRGNRKAVLNIHSFESLIPEYNTYLKS